MLNTTTVIAKDAPLGVQLWPTTSPEYAPNFTLASVTRELGSNGQEFVIWTYQSGKTRMFMANEEVACELVCTDCDARAVVANDSEPGGRRGPKCRRHARPAALEGHDCPTCGGRIMWGDCPRGHMATARAA